MAAHPNGFDWDHEKSAFYVAISVLLGSFILLGIFAVVGNISGMTSAGAIVGVWVGAIVTFYFTRSQVQTARRAGAKAGADALVASQSAVSLLQEEVREQSELAARLAERLKELTRARKRNEPSSHASDRKSEE